MVSNLNDASYGSTPPSTLPTQSTQYYASIILKSLLSNDGEFFPIGNIKFLPHYATPVVMWLVSRVAKFLADYTGK